MSNPLNVTNQSENPAVYRLVLPGRPEPRSFQSDPRKLGLPSGPIPIPTCCGPASQYLGTAMAIVGSLVRQFPDAGFVFRCPSSTEQSSFSPRIEGTWITIDLLTNEDVQLFALATWIGLRECDDLIEWNYSTKQASWLLRHGKLLTDHVHCKLSTFDLIRQLTCTSEVEFKAILEEYVESEAAEHHANEIPF